MGSHLLPALRRIVLGFTILLVGFAPLGLNLPAVGQPPRGSNLISTPEVTVSEQASAMRPAIEDVGHGRFLVLWHHASVTQLLGRFVSIEDGQPDGDAFVISDASDGRNPAAPSIVRTRESGGFAVIWKAGPDVRLKRFSDNGTPVGASLSINAQPISDQSHPVATRLEDGRSVVVWLASDPRLGVRARFVDSGGNLVGSDFAISGTGEVKTGPVQITGLDDGRFAAIWHEGDNDVAASTRTMMSVHNADGSVSVAPRLADLGGRSDALAIAPLLREQGQPGTGSFFLLRNELQANQIVLTAPLFDGKLAKIRELNVTGPRDPIIPEWQDATAVPGERIVVVWAERLKPEVSPTARRIIRAKLVSPTDEAASEPLTVSEGTGERTTPAVAATRSPQTGKTRVAIVYVSETTRRSGSTQRSITLRMASCLQP